MKHDPDLARQAAECRSTSRPDSNRLASLATIATLLVAAAGFAAVPGRALAALVWSAF